MFGLSPLYMKLIGGLVAALILLGLVMDRGRWMRRAHSDEAQLATICAAVRTAADNPKMDCKLAAQQIGLLGQSIANLKTGIAHQNAAVNAWAAKSASDKAAAAQASRNAQARARGPEATSERLKASSRAGGPSCAPSKALEGAWR